ncbi:MAG: transposase [Clostridia bacterium]|nr:transposase [Clostridia bacterium]
MEEKKNRKTMRLQGANYSDTGVVFLTFCTQERRCMLSRIVGTGVPDGPLVELTQYGKTANKYINQLNEFYNDISIESYVIMPNHIHILLHVKEKGPSGTPVPTMQNSTVARFVSTFKRFCNKEYGKNIWQYRSYDHIIRNRQDHEEHLRYIYENPLRWRFDQLYKEE